MLHWFSLETSVHAIVLDWRIAAVLGLIRTLVIVYMFVRSILLWTVVEYEDIVASYNSWAYTAWNNHIDQASHGPVEPMCNGDPSFDFRPKDPMLTGGLFVSNFSCPSFQMGEVFQEAGDEMNLLVSEVRHHYRRPGCENGIPQGNNISDFESYSKACTSSHYVQNIEQLPLFTIHNVAARGLDIVKNQLECTVVNSAREEIARVSSPTGNGWPYTLGQLLSYVGEGGTTLDSVNEGNTFDMLAGSPRMRFTGFIMTVKFLYWNYAPAAGELKQYYWYKSFPFNWQPSTPRCEVTVEIERQAWGFKGAFRDGDDLVFKNVARVKQYGRGKFGRISWLLIMTNLVQAVVLVGLARAITRFIATRLYGYSQLNRIVAAGPGAAIVVARGQSDHSIGNQMHHQKVVSAPLGTTTVHVEGEQYPPCETIREAWSCQITPPITKTEFDEIPELLDVEDHEKNLG